MKGEFPNDSSVHLNINSLMQYPNVEARNWRLAFKIFKGICTLFLSGALHLDGKQQSECHTITIFNQCKLLCNVIWIHHQMTVRSATWRLFKQFKRFLPCGNWHLYENKSIFWKLGNSCIQECYHFKLCESVPILTP